MIYYMIWFIYYLHSSEHVYKKILTTKPRFFEKTFRSVLESPVTLQEVESEMHLLYVFELKYVIFSQFLLNENSEFRSINLKKGCVCRAL